MELLKESMGCKVYSRKTFLDERGSFSQLAQFKDFPYEFKQCNVSYSRAGVFRGIHFRKSKPEAKLVNVIYGDIVDCVIDLRRDSKTFGQKDVFILGSDTTLLIPPGFGHGFYAVTPAAFLYMVSEEWDKDDEDSIHPSLFEDEIHHSIDHCIISKKDLSAKTFEEWREQCDLY